MLACQWTLVACHHWRPLPGTFRVRAVAVCLNRDTALPRRHSSIMIKVVSHISAISWRPAPRSVFSFSSSSSHLRPPTCALMASNTRITKTQRWLDLIAYLLGRRFPVEVGELMEGVPAYAEKWRTGDRTDQATARRVFERDKDELRELGIAIETVTYSIEGQAEETHGYRLSRGDFYLPYLKIVERREGRPGRAASSGAPGEVVLLPQEAAAAIEALRRAANQASFPFAAEASSALRKLAFDLDLERFGTGAVHLVERPGTAEMLGTLRTLSDAMLARKRVTFSYQGAYRGERTEREVEPYGLYYKRDWYLVGHDATRNAIRVFRVARADALTVNARKPKEPDFEVPGDFRLQNYLHREAWQMGESDPVEVRVRFTFPAAALAERNQEGELVETLDDGSTVRCFRVQRVEPFLRWVLSHAGDADIVAPAEMKEELRTLAAEVVDRHATEVSNG